MSVPLLFFQSKCMNKCTLRKTWFFHDAHVPQHTLLRVFSFSLVWDVGVVVGATAGAGACTGVVFVWCLLYVCDMT